MSERRLPVVALAVALVWVAAGVLPARVQAAGGNVFVELARPQCDDLGRYVPCLQPEHMSVTGFVATRRPVVRVVVNGVQAELFEADYHCFGQPPGFGSVGFVAPVYLYPDTVLAVDVTDSAGAEEVIVFHPQEAQCLSRLRSLWYGAQTDPYACLRLANAEACADDYSNAFVNYGRCTSLAPDFFLGWYFLGLCDYDDDRWNDCAVHLQRCGQLRPDFFLWHYELGRCYEKRGDWSRAIVQYRDVTSRRPRFAAAYWRLGVSLGHDNKWGDAERQYRRATELSPKFGAAYRGLGEALSRQGKWGESTTALRKATQLRPSDARSRALLGASLQHEQKPAEAAQQYRKALGLNPYDGQAHSGLAQSMYRSGRYDKAWQHVHDAEKAGVQPPAQFVQELRRKMPEPKVTEQPKPRPQPQTRGQSQQGRGQQGRGGRGGHR